MSTKSGVGSNPSRGGVVPPRAQRMICWRRAAAAGQSVVVGRRMRLTAYSARSTSSTASVRSGGDTIRRCNMRVRIARHHSGPGPRLRSPLRHEGQRA